MLTIFGVHEGEFANLIVNDSDIRDRVRSQYTTIEYEDELVIPWAARADPVHNEEASDVDGNAELFS